MQPVPATDDFTITWPDPKMAEAPWIGDRMHFPGPTVQFARYLVGGFQERILSAPVIFANGYQFSLPPTLPDPPPDVVAGGLAVWHDDYAPRIREFCERVRGTDFDSMTAPRIAEALEPLADEALECLRLTIVVIKQFMWPTFAMIQFLEDELGSDGPMLSGMLLQGSQNATAESGAGLSGLTELAAGSPELAAALTAGNHSDLEKLPSGPEFVAALEGFLDEFGWRVETWGTLQVPTWAEDPTTPLTLIGRYLADTNGDLASPAQRSAEQRAAAVVEVESRLDAAKLEPFRELLAATLEHVAVSEDRARWQLSAIGVMRLPALALGRKLVEAGALDSADDIFFLTVDEAKRAATDPGEWVRTTASGGRDDFARWEQLTPPPFLGVPPDPAQMP